MAVFGTRSRTSEPMAPVGALLGAGAIWERRLPCAERKTVLRAAVVVGRMEGRSWGNEENVLR